MDDDAERRFRDTITGEWKQERDEHRQADQQRHRKSMKRSTELLERIKQAQPPGDQPEPDEARRGEHQEAGEHADRLQAQADRLEQDAAALHAEADLLQQEMDWLRQQPNDPDAGQP